VPLLDHFRPPLRVERPWDGVHSAWASMIAMLLNRGLLPPDYFAMPQVTVGGRVEIDVATMRQRAEGSGNGAVATATWAPPVLSANVEFTRQDSFEVHVMQELGGPQLRAAVELVSPANKDRQKHRDAFAVKCAAYLQRGVSVVVVDVVTERLANLHAELMTLLGLNDRLAWSSASNLYAVAYRVEAGDNDRLDLWPEELHVGRPLPTLPLWLESELVVPLNLEESYREACASLRIANEGASS
jgi:hypothetical protein